MKILTRNTVMTPLVLGVLLSLTACTDRLADKASKSANGSAATNYAASPAPTSGSNTTPSEVNSAAFTPSAATASNTGATTGAAAGATKPTDTAAVSNTATAANTETGKGVAPTNPTATTAVQKDSSASKAALSDNQIASVIKVANEAEIGAGSLAKARAENPEVRAFARHMIDEHKKNNSDESAFAKKWNASSSESEISKNIRTEATAKIAELEKISGSDFDQAYIQSQLTMHKQLLEDLDNRYIPAAQDAKLKAFLKETRKHVSTHLTSAQALASMLER